MSKNFNGIGRYEAIPFDCLDVAHSQSAVSALLRTRFDDGETCVPRSDFQSQAHPAGFSPQSFSLSSASRGVKLLKTWCPSVDLEPRPPVLEADRPVCGSSHESQPDCLRITGRYAGSLAATGLA